MRLDSSVVKRNGSEVLKTISNFLILNPRAISPEAVTAASQVLYRFPSVDVRAALASCAETYAEIQVDKVLRVLAGRLWEYEEFELPPPPSVAVGEVWDHIWDGNNRDYSHQIVKRTVDRYGWEDLYGQESDTASIRKSQFKKMYEDEYERFVSRWIATVCIESEKHAERVREP